MLNINKDKKQNSSAHAYIELDMCKIETIVILNNLFCLLLQLFKLIKLDDLQLSIVKFIL